MPTSPSGLPYPAASDAPNAPAQLAALVTALESVWGTGAPSVRYRAAVGSNTTIATTGNGTRATFAVAEYTHPDVTPAADFSYFTVNRTGVWRGIANLRRATNPGVFVNHYWSDDVGASSVIYGASSYQPGGSSGATYDFNSSFETKLVAGSRIAVWMFASFTGGLDTPNDALAARSNMALSFVRATL
jgi:hypothetical protein